ALILDMDGDGRKEVAFQVGGNLAFVRWNNGFHLEDVQQTDITYSQSLRALDINGDGLDDIIKPLAGGFAVYPNRYPSRVKGFLASDRYEYSLSDIDPQ